jgi:hypothetical protein
MIPKSGNRFSDKIMRKHKDSSSAHARLQREARPVDHELAVTAVMNGLRLLLRRIDPGLQHFEDEQIIVFDEAPVGYLAFQVGETFGDERRLDARCRQPGQAVFFKFVDRAAGRIADLHHFARQSARRNGDHAFAGRAERRETEIVAADDARDLRRLELDHHVPGHGDDVGVSAARRCEQHHGSRLEQLVDFW